MSRGRLSPPGRRSSSRPLSQRAIALVLGVSQSMQHACPVLADAQEVLIAEVDCRIIGYSSKGPGVLEDG